MNQPVDAVGLCLDGQMTQTHVGNRNARADIGQQVGTQVGQPICTQQEADRVAEMAFVEEPNSIRGCLSYQRDAMWTTKLEPKVQHHNHSKFTPVTTLSNEQLILRCRRGDNRAWQQLIERYARLVHSIPVRYGLSAAEVDDVGQEVFLALAQGLSTLDDPESLPAWLMTTARRYSWRAIQKRKRENPLVGGDLAETEVGEVGGHLGSGNERVLQHFGRRTPSMNELLEGWQSQELLATGLGQLGDRCRDLLTMIFLDPTEPSYDEISTHLSVPKGSIGPTRNRCLQQLRSILEGLGFGASLES